MELENNFNIEDFLNMKNEDIMEKNGGKKFDIVLMNPPYSGNNNQKIHLEFVKKCLDIADKQITIMPFSFIDKTNNNMDNKYNEKFDKYLLEVEEVDSKKFKGTAMANTGIYLFINNKENNQNISIKYLNKELKYLSSLNDKSDFNEYENNFIKYLENKGSQDFIGGRSGGSIGLPNKSELAHLSKTDYINLQKEKIIVNCQKIKKYFDNHKGCFALICAKALGGPGNTNYFSSNSGKIFNSYEDLEKYFLDINSRGGFNVLLFNSEKSAKNCKEALLRPLFKFILLKTQKDQNLTHRHNYKYVPAINWSDDRVKTDEGLLEVCGCPKYKCKEYAEYCKKVIDKVDKK